MPRFRDELLNGENFYSLKEAQIIIEKMEETLQHDETTFSTGLQAAGTGGHCACGR